jgi:hypothetical protein
MTRTAHTDSEGEPRVERPARKTKPTATLLQHAERAALPSQQKAINEFHAAEAKKRAADDFRAIASSRIITNPTPNSSQSHSADGPPATPDMATASRVPGKSKRPYVEETSDEDSDSEGRENARFNPKPSKGEYDKILS